ncbi:MAG TPA: helix-turn-helix domain-containing protein, partial [Cytophagales bacterium]|nr:helix-turn-helix domain-containing protein [Cytophagales bacterium]
MRHIVANTFKKCVVAAPTGIAAINAGGVTLHSLLQLPMLPFVPTSGYYDHNVAGTKKSLFMQQRMGRDKVKLLNELELLIIDEASMLRADLLDCIDLILKHRRGSNLPFGGLQVLFIGDLYQLPPVAKREEEAILREFYPSNYFFNAEVIRNEPPICIELNKVYRQQDEFFVNILNEVRDSKLKQDNLELLNERYNPYFEPDATGEYITICSHNHKADEINQRQLTRLATPEKIYEAEKTGDFFAEPVDPILKLKVGAQVIFIKNDKTEMKRFYNGKIGIISKIDDAGITVKFPHEQTSITLEKETWENKRVEFNEETDEIEEKVLGTYTQFPIKLAWAITIHKSQGLTFDKAIVDAGDSFAPGQVYVALSRLRTLEGMVLKSKIGQEAIKTDPLVREFSKSFERLEQLELLLIEARKEYIPTLLYKVFDYDKVVESFAFHRDSVSKRKFDNLPEAQTWNDQLFARIQKQGQVAAKFIMQLQGIVQGSVADYAVLNERVTKAVEYFSNEVDAYIMDLQLHKAKYAIKKNTKAYVKDLELLIIILKRHREKLTKSALLTKAIAGEPEFLDAFIALNPQSSKEADKVKIEKQDTKEITFQLYQEHKDLNKIIELRGLAESTVMSHLAYYIA